MSLEFKCQLKFPLQNPIKYVNNFLINLKCQILKNTRILILNLNLIFLNTVFFHKFSNYGYLNPLFV